MMLGSRAELEVGELTLLKFNRNPRYPGYRPPKEQRTKLGPSATPYRILKNYSPLTSKVALPVGSQMHDVTSAVHLQTYSRDQSIASRRGRQAGSMGRSGNIGSSSEGSHERIPGSGERIFRRFDEEEPGKSHLG